MPNPKLALLEANQLWPDFHATFLNYWRESIADALPDYYEARIGEQVTLVRSDGYAKRVGPDVSIVRSQSVEYDTNAESSATTVLLDHLEIEEEICETRIEILLRKDRRLVTIIELLSPSNKVEPGWSRYLDKRSTILGQPIHLVELDLLAGGHRLTHRQPLPDGEYFCFVSRLCERPRCSVTAWRGPTPMPTIRIPLLAPDGEIASPLQIVFETSFARGRYVFTTH